MSHSPTSPPVPDNSPQSNIDQDSPEYEQQIGMLGVRDSPELDSPTPMAFETPSHPTPPRHSSPHGPTTRSKSRAKQSDHRSQSLSPSTPVDRPQFKFFSPTRERPFKNRTDQAPSAIPSELISAARRLQMGDPWTPMPGGSNPHTSPQEGASYSVLPGTLNLSTSTIHPPSVNPSPRTSSLLSIDHSGSGIYIDPRHARSPTMVQEAHRLELMWQSEKQEKQKERYKGQQMATLVQLKDRDLSDQKRSYDVLQSTHKVEVT